MEKVIGPKPGLDHLTGLAIVFLEAVSEGLDRVGDRRVISDNQRYFLHRGCGDPRAMTSHIIVTRHDGWAELRIDREDKRNAMNRAARDGLMRAFEQLRGEAKAIVLTGTGGAAQAEGSARFAAGI